VIAQAIGADVNNFDWGAALKTGDYILVPLVNAKPAVLSANGWITKYVPITYHSIPAIIVHGRLAESCGKWAGGNQLYTKDARQLPGIYACADIYDIEKYAPRELLGDGDA
jgi:hypothetical protein